MPTQPLPPSSPELRQLRDRLRKLMAIKPVNNGYTWEGVVYTKRKYDQMVSSLQKQIADVEKSLAPTAMETTRATAKTQRELVAEAQDLRLKYNSVQARRKDIETAIKKAATVEEQKNLQAWLPAFQENERRLKEALDSFDKGFRPAVVPQPITLLSVDQMRKSTPGPQPTEQPAKAPVVGQPSVFTPGATTAGVATPSAATTTGGVAPTPGVAYGGMPTGGAPTTSPTEKTTTPTGQNLAPVTPPTSSGGQPAPPSGQQPGGAWVTNPDTGEQVYLPPNIDFAWLASQVPDDWKKAARQMLGPIFDVYMADEELQKFIERMMKTPDIDPARFNAELQQTTWWRTHTEAQRAFLQNQATDPATLNQKISQTTEELRQLALQRGLTTSDKALNDAALSIIRDGGTTQAALNWLGEQTLMTSPGASQLIQGYYGQQVKETAASYGIPVSDTTLTKWVGDIATGNQTIQSFESWARQMAKNMYPSLADGFDRGLSFTTMTEPYAQFASQLLEIPTSQMNFTDPKWSAAFNSKDAKGNPTTMSYGDWMDYLRSDPSFGWEYTDNARSQAYDVALQLGQLFGRA